MCDATQNFQETGNEVLVSRKRDAVKDLCEECQRTQGLRILSIRPATGVSTQSAEKGGAAHSITLGRLVMRLGASIGFGRRSDIN